MVVRNLVRRLAYHLLAVKDVNTLRQCLQVSVRANESTVQVIDVVALRHLRRFYLADTCRFVHSLNVIFIVRFSCLISCNCFLGNIDCLDIVASFKTISSSCGRINRMKVQSFQSTTVVESLVSYCSHGVRDIDGGQSTTVVESRVSYCSHGVRDIDGGQFSTVVESLVSY